MTWREFWQSTVTNIKTLLGFSPPPPPPPAPIVRRKPLALTGTIVPPEQSDAEGSPQTIDLTPTRPSPPSAPLRTRKQPMVPVDVALDAEAFAVRKHVPAPIEPAPILQPTPPPVTPEVKPEVTFTRQGVSPVDVPNDADFASESTVEPYFSQASEPTPELSANEDVGGGFDDVDETDYHNGDGDGHGNNYGNGGNAATDNSDDHDNNDGDDEGVPLTTLLESLLFVAPEAVEPRQLAQTLGQPLEVIELGLAELADYYQRSLRGLRLQRFNSKVQLVTAPVAAPFIETFLNLDHSTKLSSPALETLAVIAYRQPVTRAQIESVRGVDCAGVLRSLTQRGLVAEVGRLEGIGRPILYGVTDLFMQHFGLMEMTELPPLEETEADRLWAATVLDEQEADAPKP